MKWTFGIITSQKSCGFMPQVIASIQALAAAEAEIVVVGGQPLGLGERHVPFDESKGDWITRKKNIIAEIAVNPNLCITHDYVSFLPDWYGNFVQFGDDWDVCMTRILNADGKRFRDWVSYDADGIAAPWIPPSFIPYSDQSRTRRMYASGTYFCVKKSFLLQNKLDEKLMWGQSEDCEWSCRVRGFWNYRCNAASTVKFLKMKEHLPTHTPD